MGSLNLTSETPSLVMTQNTIILLFNQDNVLLKCMYFIVHARTCVCSHSML